MGESGLTRRGLFGWLGSMMAMSPLAANELCNQEENTAICSRCGNEDWILTVSSSSSYPLTQVLTSLRCCGCGMTRRSDWYER